MSKCVYLAKPFSRCEASISWPKVERVGTKEGNTITTFKVNQFSRINQTYDVGMHLSKPMKKFNLS